jgi:hypothetical protein
VVVLCRNSHAQRLNRLTNYVLAFLIGTTLLCDVLSFWTASGFLTGWTRFAFAVFTAEYALKIWGCVTVRRRPAVLLSRGSMSPGSRRRRTPRPRRKACV